MLGKAGFVSISCASPADYGDLDDRVEAYPTAPSANSMSAVSSFASGGKTQLYISHKINIGLGYISDLENGRRKGTTVD